VAVAFEVARGVRQSSVCPIKLSLWSLCPLQGFFAGIHPLLLHLRAVRAVCTEGKSQAESGCTMLRSHCSGPKLPDVETALP
jgi:hypothetical protein